MCRFGTLAITIVVVVSVEFFSMDGSATLVLAASFSPSELYICHCCTLVATDLKNPLVDLVPFCVVFSY